MNRKEKELHVIAAKYILGEDITTRISGKSYKIDSFVELLETSKELYNLLKEEKDLTRVSELMDQKRDLVIKFKKQTGINWRL